LPGEVTSATLSSTGVGLRFVSPRNFTARVDYAHIIQGKEIAAVGGSRTFNFSIAVLF
jgi:hypothetical protein